MKIDEKVPPRCYQAGMPPVTIHDCGRVELEADEQITFVGPDGSEHDVCRKPWGYYATASVNDRLPRMGLRPVLVRNAAGRYYVLLVEAGKEAEMRAYIEEQAMAIMVWLDGSESLAQLFGSEGTSET